jgi:hypothetical protein
MTEVMVWCLVAILKILRGSVIYRMYYNNYCNLSKTTLSISGDWKYTNSLDIISKNVLNKYGPLIRSNSIRLY